MQDLNDLYYYAQVVDHGGFSAAARTLGIPKSKLSRRIALIEERLGVRLIRGALESVLPDWSPPRVLVHAVFPSRRGLLPAVRRFIDVLGAELTSPAGD